MGALRFVPATDPHAVEPDWSLLALARESERALAGEAGVALRELALTGGSPQGARPKALVQHDAATGHVSTRGDAPGVPWLVKFPAQGEHKEVCAVEQLYAELARDCGLEVPASALFDLSPRLAAFGVARFDGNAVCACRCIAWRACCKWISACRAAPTTRPCCGPPGC